MSLLVEVQQPRSGWKALEVKPLDESLWQAWVIDDGAQDRRSAAAQIKGLKWTSIAGLIAAARLRWRDVKLSMQTRVGAAMWKSAFIILLGLGVMPAITLAEDLSRYREFQLGTDLSTIAKQTGVSPSQAKDVHSRPVLIQELIWRPQPLGSSSKAEAAAEVAFNFFDGELSRIIVKYDRFQTEGLTTDDMVDAITATYGMATRPTPLATTPGHYGDQEEVIAQWQDAQYRFELVRNSYGPSYCLIGILKRLEAPAQAAVLEATRLDDREAPQREAARIASEEEAAKIKLEKARLENKPRFRP